LVFLDRSLRYEAEDLVAIFGALEGEDEVIVGMDPSPEKLFKGYAVFTVTDGVIDGLSGRANQDLRLAIIRKWAEAAAPIEKRTPTKLIEDIQLREPSPKRGPINALFDQGDLLLDGPDHRHVLKAALAAARQRVVIHSTFITVDGWTTVLPMLLGAAARGTSVQIFWGQADDKTENSSSRNAAEALKAAVAEAGRSDQIVVHPFTTDSHAKILFGDDGSGRWSAVIGSCNWLASDFESFEASIKLRDPVLVGETIKHVAALSLGSEGVWHNTAGDLTALGRRIACQPRGNGRTAPVRLLLAPDHSELVLEARDRAEKRIMVTSHRIGLAGKPLVILPALAAAHAKRVASALYYGRPTGLVSGIDAAGLTTEFARKGVDIRPVHRPRLHSKTLAWDDNALAVTSQNWLSADPSETALRREIGVFVELNKIADTFIRRFEHAKLLNSAA
jgi:phosphatidylserine/phosphatidylglycerophosphate/cardiolipin synthase-like enzyme